MRLAALALSLLVLPATAFAGKKVACDHEAGRDTATFLRNADLRGPDQAPSEVPWARVDFRVERAAQPAGAFEVVVRDAAGEEVRREQVTPEPAAGSGAFTGTVSIAFPKADPMFGTVLLVGPDGTGTCAVAIDLYESRMKPVK